MNLTKTDKIAFLLRGHIRDSLENNELYNFLKKLIKNYNVDIYIYTFNIKHTGKIYTQDSSKVNRTIITELDIKKYLHDIPIKQLIISDNSFAKTTNDRFLGPVSYNKFLHMWQSIHAITEYVKETNIEYDYIFNMRIDYFELVKFTIGKPSFGGLRKLFYIDIFDNFINKVDKTKNINLLNIDCDSIVKKTNVFNSKSLDFFKKKNIKKLDLNYDDNDILYGIDNLFAGKIDYLYKLTDIFANRMDEVFDFLGKIFNNMGELTKPEGPPHEAILPIMIKNYSELI